jgi:hypothetical protein
VNLKCCRAEAALKTPRTTLCAPLMRQFRPEDHDLAGEFERQAGNKGSGWQGLLGPAASGSDTSSRAATTSVRSPMWPLSNSFPRAPHHFGDV